MSGGSPTRPSADMALVFNTTNPKSTLISLNMSSITKLTSTNFITWRLQIKSLLEAHELHVFIDDADLTPTATITDDNGAEVSNPNFAAWKRQDKLLYSSLIGSLSLSIQPIVARATSTKEIWQILTQTYGKPSRAHVKQIKQHLKASSKGTKSITDYMRSIMAKVDQLALLGSPIDHEDLLDYITDGLGDDYRAIIEMVNGRDTPITLDELHEKLLHRENTLEISTPEVVLPATANTAQSQSRSNTLPPATRGSFRGGYGGRGGSGRGYLGRCQICGTQGHSARRCPQFSSTNPTHFQNRGNHPQWQNPSQQQQQQWQNQAHHTASTVDSAPWLLDSGASHHIASDLSNLSLHSPYTGGEDVMIGNGTGLPITHTGAGSDHGSNSSQRQSQ